MLKLFSSPKNKKIFAFFFLCLFILPMVFGVTQIAKAAKDNSDGSVTIGGFYLNDPTGNGDCSGLSWYKLIPAALIDIQVIIPNVLATIVNAVCSQVIGKVMTWTVTSTNGPMPNIAQAFIAGWVSVRNLANMLIVLSFVIVGVATALRIREYEAKKFLAPLIIVALFVNFSGLFCGFVIDTSNLTMKGLLNGTQSADAVNGLMKSVYESFHKAKCDAMTGNNLGQYGVIDATFAIFYLAIGFCLTYLAIMLIIRFAVLGILFILSPLAFVFWAAPIPSAKKLWNKWWDAFLKWAFVGVGICFFLKIAVDILKSLNVQNGDMITTFTYMMVVLLVIAVGIKLTTKGSEILTAAIMAAVTGGIGFAMGAVGAGGMAGSMLGKAGQRGAKLGGAANEKMSRTQTGAAMKERTANAVAQLKEKTGFAPSGHAADQKKKRAEGEEKSAAALLGSSNQAERDRGMQMVRNADQFGAKGAGAVAAAAKRGELAQILGNDQGQIDQKMAYAGGFGYDVGAMARAGSPDAAKQDTGRIRQLREERGLSQTDAENTAVKEAYAQYRPEGLNQMNNAALVAGVKTAGSNHALRSKYMEQLADNDAIGELTKETKDSAGNILPGLSESQIAGHVDMAETRYGSKVRRPAEKSMPGLAQYNVDKVGGVKDGETVVGSIQEDRRKAGLSDLTAPQLQQEAVTGSVSKMTRNDFEKASGDVMTHQSLSGMSGQQIGWLFERGSPAAQQKAKSFVDPESENFAKWQAHMSTLAPEQHAQATKSMKAIQKAAGIKTEEEKAEELAKMEAEQKATLEKWTKGVFIK